MKNSIAIFMKSEIGTEIRKEYSFLLAAGFDDCEAEEKVISYYLSDVTTCEQKLLYVLFALIQWHVGRLSPKVHATATQLLREHPLLFPSETANEIENLLSTPMPNRKKPPKPRTIKCPWKKGTLLAYRISTCDAKKESRFWNRYVLLRIVDIYKWPASAILPDVYFDEAMHVALYHWVGDSIPPESVIDNLKFTPIAIDGPMSIQQPDRACQGFVDALVRDNKLNMAFDTSYHHYVYSLNWGTKESAATIFTEVASDIDAVLLGDLPMPHTRIPPLIGPLGFDILLIKRLEQLFPE